ncbi:MAG: M23 family metallopeptidase [Candidatus Gracilibacteria bacterium]|nr:M23 family metallopeptidase [Candidatus Gracilibacteria bacterium]
MVSSVFAGSTVIPSDLQWPMNNKSVKDTSIFFDTEDAVESSSKDRTHCSDGHFLMHAGHDIIADYNTPVKPVYEGYIVAVGNGVGWKRFMVVEHNNNGKIWTSVYWHLQNKGLIKTKLGVCNDRLSGKTLKECKVTKTTVIGYIDNITNMKDVNHLHLGIRPLPYDGDSVLGFGGCMDLEDKKKNIGRDLKIH